MKNNTKKNKIIKYQKNKYFKILVAIVFVNILLLIFLAHHFFSKEKSELSMLQKSRNIELLNIKKIVNLQKLDTPSKQISYLESIKPGDILKSEKTTIYFPKIQKNKSTKEKFKRTSFIPKVNLDDNINVDMFPKLLNKNIHNVEISEPIFKNSKTLKLMWSENEELNKNANTFLKQFLVIGGNHLILNINNSKNNLWDLKIPEILRIKFLSLVMQKYNIHKLNVSLNNNNWNDNENLLNSMYLLQLYLNHTNYDVSFDFDLPNINTLSTLTDDNKKLINEILKRGLDVDTFVLDFNSNQRTYINDRLQNISQNIADLKIALGKKLKKYKNIEFNDATLNSFIGLKIHPEYENIVYNFNDLALIKDLFNKYEFSKLYFDNLNIDNGVSNLHRSQFYNDLFTNNLYSVVKRQNVQRADIFKVFEMSANKMVINYLKFTKVNINSLDDVLTYLTQQSYVKGDKVQYNQHIYEYISDLNYTNTVPGVDSDISQWKDLGNVSKILEKQKDGHISVIKHDGKYYEK